MKNRTQLMIGVALLAGVTVLFILSQPKADKSGNKQAGLKAPGQTAAVPKKEIQMISEPEVVPELAPTPAESGATEGKDAIEQTLTETRESEKPIDPILALVDKIEDAAGKVWVLSNLAGSLARTGDAEQASAILAQAEELLNTIEADDKLAAATGFFAAAKLHAGETDAAMEMLERTIGLIEKIESAEAKLAAEEQGHNKTTL